MDETSKERGEKTEAVVLAELVQRGIPVLTPFGENHRYDFVVDVDGDLHRLQCKTGRRSDRHISFSTRSTRPRGTGYSREHYQGDIDYFIVYCEELSSIYLVDIDDAPETEMTLRIAPSKNGQTKGINWAGDYLLDAGLANLMGT